MPTRTVDVKVLADSRQYETAMAKSGASTTVLAKELDKAAAESKDFAKATIAARTAMLDATKAAESAAVAQDKQAAAAKRAARAELEAAAANKLAAEAAQKLENGEIAAEEAQRLSADAARKDRTAQIANAAATRLAAEAAEKLERASLKAATAQLAKSKAASSGTKKSLFGDGKQLAEDFAGIFGNGLRSAVKTVAALPPEIAIPVTIGAVAVGGLAFAELGSAAGAAVLTGIGAAGIGVAIAAQIKDPRVKAALNELSKDAKRTLKSSTQDFVTPIVRASSILDTTLLHIRPELRATFRTLAPDLLTLTRGASQLVENVMPGLVHSAEAFEPVANALGNELPRAGAAISEFLDDVSSDSQGAAEGLNVLIELFIVGLGAIGNAVGGAEMALDTFFNTLSLFVAVASKIPGGAKAVAPLADALKVLTDTSGKAAGGVSDFGHKAKSAATETDELQQSVGELNDQLDKMISKSLAAKEAALDFKDGLAGLSEAAQQNGTAITDNTAAGRANEHMLNDLIGKAERAREAYIDQHSATEGVTQATAEADRIFGRNINTLIEQAAKYGYNADQVRAYIARILGIPNTKGTKLELPNAAYVERQLQIIKARLDGIKSKNIVIHTTYTESGGRSGTQYSGYSSGGKELNRGYADGGIVDFRAYASGGMYEPSHVAEIVPAGTYRLMAEPETGGEAYIPLAASKRARSLDIFGETARRLGVPMVSPAALAGGGPAVTLTPSFDVRVFVGSQEITGIVRTEITQHDRALRRTVTAGGRT